MPDEDAGHAENVTEAEASQDQTEQVTGTEDESQLQTEQASQAPETPPETLKDQLTRDEVAAIVRDSLSSVLPTLVGQLDERTAQQIERRVQSATAKGFNRLMKEVAPELRGIKKAEQLGTIDAEQSKAAQTALWLEATAQIGNEEEAAPPSSQRVPNQEGQERARFERKVSFILDEYDLSMSDPEYQSDIASKPLGNDPDEAEWRLRKMAKAAARKKEARLKGATSTTGETVKKPTPADTATAQRVPPTEYKPKPTLDDAGDFLDVFLKSTKKKGEAS